jgi:hypothetical protein
MKIERVYVARALRDAGLSGVPVVQTGIGKVAVVRAAAVALEESAAPRDATLVVLAGACGGLAAVPDVPPIARVIDEHGGAWTPAGADARGVTLVAVDRIVATPADKRALAAATGAAIVDMESHALAAACGAEGTPWTVVRGVSDTPEETLPGEVLGWVTPGGGTRPLRAAWDMARRPSLVPHVRAVLARSSRVLPEVGRRTAEVVRAWLEGRLDAPARPRVGEVARVAGAGR